jgi:hypothetical protein
MIVNVPIPLLFSRRGQGWFLTKKSAFQQTLIKTIKHWIATLKKSCVKDNSLHS